MATALTITDEVMLLTTAHTPLRDLVAGLDDIAEARDRESEAARAFYRRT